MISYYIRPGGAFIKIDTTTQIVDLVLNIPTQKTLSSISDNPDYYNNTVSASASWSVTDQATYEANKNIVLQDLSSR